MMDILFVNSSMQFARYIKRIKALINQGLSATVVGYEREDYFGDNLPCTTVNLGFVDSGSYLNRIIQFIQDFFIIKKYINKASVVYAFGLDMAFISRVILCLFWKQKPKLLYEIGDIRSIMVSNNLKGRLSRMIESWILNGTSYLVVTSDAYVNSYYNKYYDYDNNKIFVIENKLEENTSFVNKKSDKTEINDRPIKIGYFGRLRCQYSWEAIKYLVESTGYRFEIILRGVNAGISDFENEISLYENITFKGPYVSPQDLTDIYSEIDLVWGAHYHADNNFLWARSCRFYESLLFNKPLIVQQGTYDERIINNYNAGITVDIRTPFLNLGNLINLDLNMVKALKNKVKKIPEDLYLYTDEHKKLAKLIKLGLM